MNQDSRMEDKIREFTDLMTWKEGHKLVITIYQITKTFPKEETYSLIDQTRRAAVSVTSNISEGFGRHGYREKLQYYYLSQSSLSEVKNLILIARDVGYLNKKDFITLFDQINLTHKLLQGLLTKTKSFLNLKSLI
jgi:four helix bundle protein